MSDVLDQARETFGQRAASLLVLDGTKWSVEASVGPDAPTHPDSADAAADSGSDTVLALAGRPLPAGQQRVLAAFAVQAAVVRDREHLREQARQAEQLAVGNSVRTALLAAVSHDLRTPLAGIKAAASSLRAEDVTWSQEDEQALLATIEESVERLDALVANLLDMSRLQMGAVNPLVRAVALDEVVPVALSGVPADRVRVEFEDDAPEVLADPGLLERVVANLVENSVRHAPEDQPVRITAGVIGDLVELRVIDRGPGVPDDSKAAMFVPFQRLGDAPRGVGVGLGLAVARGLAEACGGTVEAEDTPGGGLTMVVSLPRGGGAAAGTVAS